MARDGVFLRLLATGMATPTSITPVERDSGDSPHPDVSRLIVSLTLVSLGCLVFFPVPPRLTFFAAYFFLSANWLLLFPAERRRFSWKFLPSSAGEWKFTIVLAIIVVAIPFLPQSWFALLKGSPAEDRSFHQIMQNPVTVVALWVLLCAFFVWKWLRLRRIVANEAGGTAL